MAEPTPDAVIFDFDGVIVDTEPLHWKAFTAVLQPLGLAFSWDDYKAHYLGFDDRDAIREAFRRHGRSLDDGTLGELIESKARTFESLAAREKPAPFPGVLELVTSLAAARVPLALCSGALRRDALPILRSLGIDGTFDAIVTADEVAASKPDPESYVLALDRLRRKDPCGDLHAFRSVAVEDTPAGIKAARGAGLRVLALSNSFGEGDLAEADLVTRSLERISVADLASLAALRPS